MRPLNEVLVERATWDACANWVRWRDDYEYPSGGLWSNRPILTCNNRFDAFCSEYGLNRTVHMQDHTKKFKAGGRSAREELRKRIAATSPPKSSCEVDKWRKSINESHFTWAKGSPFGISMASKLLCFSDPVCFPPMDTFNRTGMKILSDEVTPKYPPHFPYKKFAKRFREMLNENDVQEVLDVHIQKIAQPGMSVQKLKARVLDLTLMLEGGFGTPLLRT